MEAPLRRRGSLSARVWSDVPSKNVEARVPLESEGDKDGFACPRQIKPLLHFYKYLQPLPDGRKLQLQLPPTVVCDKKDGREELLALRTDASGAVVKDDKGPAWRKRLLSDFLGEDQQNAASLLTVGMDDVVAVRNVAHWKSLGGGTNSKSLVLTRRAFDTVVSAPCELAFSVQKYVRCRGSHASIFRVTWGERENRRFAINIFNEIKVTDAPSATALGKTASMAENRPQGTPYDATLRQMTLISPFYLVTATSGSDPKRQQLHAKLPRIRGNPVADGLEAVRRIIEHFTAQLPGIKVRELTADFIKDCHGVWWFIRVMNFDACYRIEIPQSIQTNSEIDSAAYIHGVLRSKYFRQTLRTITTAQPGNCMVPQCSLCGCSCDLPKTLRHELQELGKAIPVEGVSDDMLRVLSEYRMTVKMVVSTLFQLRQRGESLPLWEHAALLLMKNPACQASEFTVCYLCYRIYKSQLSLSRIALELNEAYGVVKPCLTSSQDSDGVESTTRSDSAALMGPPADRMSLLCSRIDRFNREKCVSLIPDDLSPTRARLSLPQYTSVKGVDVDPTCSQLRLIFFFHELQDGGPALSATDFYLEYHMGQHFSRLDFDGSKRHTPNRWQLCEARVHYLLATTDGFGDYCDEKRLHIKMKTIAGDEYHGHASLSLRPLLSAAKWYTTSVQSESRVDYLLELKTDTFGLLTLKMTLGLMIDPVPLNQVRELIRDEDFLRDGSLAVFWPPPWFQSCSLPVPVDWIGALMPSEYISILPRQKRQNLADRRQIRPNRGSADNGSLRKLLQDGKSPSVRFSVPERTGASESYQEVETSVDPAGLSAASPLRQLRSACIVAKRLIYRVAGETSAFPSIVLGHILRHARFLSPVQRLDGIASWTEPARFDLTANYTIDTITRDVEVESIAALCVMGELLLVLLRCKLIPAALRVADLERIITPYWLLRLDSRGGRDGSTVFESVALRATSVSSQQRMVWNRAIRRCQVAHFCGEFRAYTRAVVLPDEQDHVRVPMVSTFEEMQVLQRKMSYRVKMQAHVLCEIVEIMEVNDSGIIDIAELRSLHKCIQAARSAASPSLEELRFGDCEHLETESLAALSSRLTAAQEAIEATFVECLMSSDKMVEALAQFDRFGTGAMSFDAFWQLTDTVLREAGLLFVSREDEPTCTGFCLRHGNTDMFALDRCCVLCSSQYQDQEFLLPTHAPSESQPSHSSGSESDCDHSADGDGCADEPVSPLPVKQLGTMEKLASVRDPRRSVEWSELCNFNALDEPLDESALRTTLQQLKAAEWHIRYSRDSLDRTPLETLLSERRSSSVMTGRRSSNASDRSPRKGGLTPSYSVTDFVTEAEKRKQQLFSSTPQVIEPKITKRLRKRRRNASGRDKTRVHKSSALRSTRIQTSHSVSTLLRMELKDSAWKGGRSIDADRSLHLIDTVHRGEAKRNKLDRLVLAELEDVKQRLARLLASS